MEVVLCSFFAAAAIFSAGGCGVGGWWMGLVLMVGHQMYRGSVLNTS